MSNTNTTTTTPPCSSSSSSTCSSPVLVSGVPADSASEDDADLASSSPSPPLTEEPPVDNDNDDINDDDDDTTEKTKTKQSVNVNESTNPTVATTTASRLSPSSILRQWYRTWFHDGRQNHHQQQHHTSTTTTTMNAVGRQCHDALTFYVQFMTLSPSHPDKILKFLQYTFYMVSQALIWHDHRPQRQQARPNIATAQWLDKLYQEFTWARYILRIVQFPVALHAAWHQSWTLTAAPGSNDDDPLTLLLPSRHCRRRRQSIYNVLGRILTYSMVVYYPTELMAYLLWMKPKAPPDETRAMSEVTTTLVPTSSSLTTTTLHHHHHHHPQQSPHGSIVSLLYHVVTTWRDTPPLSSSGRRSKFPPPETWSYLSCRCWLIYIVTELIQSYVQYQELTTTTTTTTLPTLVDPSKQQQQRRHILLQSLRNLLFLLPCTAWSMSKWDSQPILSSRTVNTLLWFESIVSLYQAVQQQRTTTTSPLSPPVIATTQPE